MPYKDPEVQRAYQRERVARTRAEWLAENGPCKRCGTWDDLQVDHIDGSQKVSHNVWSWSKSRREAELDKCQVLCQDCHLEKSRENDEQPPATTHGTRTMYRYHGCRCAECRAWNAARVASIRARYGR